MLPTGHSAAAALPASWRANADHIERFAPAAAVAFRDCAAELDRELLNAENAVLTISEAAMVSGLSKDYIRHLIADGDIPNHGKKGRPRARSGDLPCVRRVPRSSPYSPDADAIRLSRPIPRSLRHATPSTPQEALDENDRGSRRIGSPV